MAFVLIKNRLLVQEDQLLRAQNTGKTRTSNPNAYEFRKRYHKLYYQFKPHHYYWILVIIARKFMIAGKLNASCSSSLPLFDSCLVFRLSGSVSLSLVLWADLKLLG